MKKLHMTADDIRHFEAFEKSSKKPIDLNIQKRIVVERAIVRHALKALLAAGYRVAIDYGEGDLQARHDRSEPDALDKLMADVGACDDEYIQVYRPFTPEEKAASPAHNWKRFAWIHLIYGNDGIDVIADHSGGLTDVLGPTDLFAESLA